MNITKGKWAVSKFTDCEKIVVSRDKTGKEKCLAVALDKDVPEAEAEANAKLMAMAPTLLLRSRKILDKMCSLCLRHCPVPNGRCEINDERIWLEGLLAEFFGTTHK